MLHCDHMTAYDKLIFTGTEYFINCVVMYCYTVSVN